MNGWDKGGMDFYLHDKYGVVSRAPEDMRWYGYPDDAYDHPRVGPFNTAEECIKAQETP